MAIAHLLSDSGNGWKKSPVDLCFFAEFEASFLVISHPLLVDCAGGLEPCSIPGTQELCDLCHRSWLPPQTKIAGNIGTIG